MAPIIVIDDISPAVADLLSRLSRRGIRLVIEREQEKPPVARMVRTRGGSSRVSGSVDWATFLAARNDALLAFDASRGGWSLSRTGRVAVRRRRAASTVTGQGMVDTGSAPGPDARLAEAARYNEAESPLAWLRRRADKGGQPLVGDEQYDAGERLRADLYYARLTPRVTSPWTGIPSASGPRSAPGVGIEMSDRVVAAKQRVTGALEAVGPELAGILIDVCGHLQGLEAIERRERWPKRSAKLVLHKALTALARHYGLLPAATVDKMITLRLRHWGADDYRPYVTEPRPPPA